MQTRSTVSFQKLSIVHALAIVMVGFESCTSSESDGPERPVPSVETTELVGDYLFVSNTKENGAFDVCDPRMMYGYSMASPLARQIANDTIWDMSNDTEDLTLLDSLFSPTSSRFYMSIVERTMNVADGYYSEALGVMAKRFFEERTCTLAQCCWENGCADERSVQKWAYWIASDLLIGSEDDPLSAFRLWSSQVRSRAKERCDLADLQRTDEIFLAIKKSIVRSMKSAAN